MLDFFKRLFGFSAKPVEAAPSAPYKVPEPAATTPIPSVVAVTAPTATEAPAKAPAKPRSTTAKPAAKPKAEAKPKAAAPKAKAPAKPRIKVAK